MAVDAIPSFGASLVGLAVASFLCGCMLVQLCLYWGSESASREGAWRLKLFVSYLGVIDLLQLFFQGAYVYDGLITNLGNPSWFQRPPWSLSVATGLSVCISTPVQMFYAWRVYILIQRRIPLPTFITSISLFSFCCCIATSVKTLLTGSSAKSGEIFWIVEAWLAADIMTDMLIVGTLYCFLTRGKTGCEFTDALLNKLAFLIISMGLLPTLFELGHLISFTVAPNSFAHLTFNFISPKLYTNAFMAILNARKYVVDAGERPTPINFAATMTCRRVEIVELPIDTPAESECAVGGSHTEEKEIEQV